MSGHNGTSATHAGTSAVPEPESEPGQGAAPRPESPSAVGDGAGATSRHDTSGEYHLLSKDPVRSDVYLSCEVTSHSTVEPPAPLHSASNHPTLRHDLIEFFDSFKVCTMLALPLL